MPLLRNFYILYMRKKSKRKMCLCQEKGYQQINSNESKKTKEKTTKKIHIHNEDSKAFEQISFELSTPLSEIMMIDD